MGFIRAGLWLALVGVAGGSGVSPGWSWRQDTQSEELAAWPVLESGGLHVCSATISYVLPDTLTHAQDRMGLNKQFEIKYYIENKIVWIKSV